ncbi:FHA domain-containing protein [Frankia sp. AiPs1]
MGVLQRFERRLGGLVEGAFAKVFKGGVEPVEIASALARETDDRRAVSANRVLVPNEFAVELASGDFARLSPYDRALCDELAEMVREHATEQRYTFVGPVSVRLAEAADLDVGVFRIRSSVAAADQGVVSGRRSRPPRPSVPGTPHLLITTKAPSGAGEREYPLDAETTVIGRSVECDIRLNDTGVSRRHGEIRRLPDGQFLYVDAGSTNGSLVNGRAAKQVKLVNGDRIELGTATIVFRREDGRTGSARAGSRATPAPARAGSHPDQGVPADRTPPPGRAARRATPAPGRATTPAPARVAATPAPGRVGQRPTPQPERHSTPVPQDPYRPASTPRGGRVEGADRADRGDPHASDRRGGSGYPADSLDGPDYREQDPRDRDLRGAGQRGGYEQADDYRSRERGRGPGPAAPVRDERDAYAPGSRGRRDDPRGAGPYREPRRSARPSGDQPDGNGLEPVGLEPLEDVYDAQTVLPGRMESPRRDADGRNRSRPDRGW